MKEAFFSVSPQSRGARIIRGLVLWIMVYPPIIVLGLQYFVSMRGSPNRIMLRQAKGMAEAVEKIVLHYAEWGSLQQSNSSSRDLATMERQDSHAVRDEFGNFYRIRLLDNGVSVQVMYFGRNNVVGGRGIDADWSYICTQTNRNTWLISIDSSPLPAQAKEVLQRRLANAAPPSGVGNPSGEFIYHITVGGKD
jgi:hypothetical protein